MFTFLSRYWWVTAVRGVLAILLGVCAFIVPRDTISALVLAFGLVATFDGMFAVGAALEGRSLPYWWVLLLQGLVGIAIGAFTFIRPDVTAVALLVYIAFWAIALGVLQMVAAVRLRREMKGEWLIGLSGLVGVVFGVLVMLNPVDGSVAIIVLIGSYALVWGTIMLAAGVDMWRARKTFRELVA